LLEVSKSALALYSYSMTLFIRVLSTTIRYKEYCAISVKKSYKLSINNNNDVKLKIYKWVGLFFYLFLQHTFYNN